VKISLLAIDHQIFLSQDLQAYGRLNEVSSGACQVGEFPFPIIEDTNRMLAKRLGMIDPDQFDTKGLPLTARAVCCP
jgi:alkyl hydroperoxide reductase subunit AhpC